MGILKELSITTQDFSDESSNHAEDMMYLSETESVESIRIIQLRSKRTQSATIKKLEKLRPQNFLSDRYARLGERASKRRQRICENNKYLIQLSSKFHEAAIANQTEKGTASKTADNSSVISTADHEHNQHEELDINDFIFQTYSAFTALFSHLENFKAWEHFIESSEEMQDSLLLEMESFNNIQHNQKINNNNALYMHKPDCPLYNSHCIENIDNQGSKNNIGIRYKSRSKKTAISNDFDFTGPQKVLEPIVETIENSNEVVENNVDLNDNLSISVDINNNSIWNIGKNINSSNDFDVPYKRGGSIISDNVLETLEQSLYDMELFNKNNTTKTIESGLQNLHLTRKLFEGGDCKCFTQISNDVILKNAQSNYRNIDANIRAMLNRKQIPLERLYELEREIRQFFIANPTQPYSFCLENPYIRLLAHGLCKYLGLISKSDITTQPKQTIVQNKFEYFRPPVIYLSQLLIHMKCSNQQY